MKFYTTSLTSGTLVINAADGALQVSIKPNASSSCNVIGTEYFKNVAPAAISLGASESVTITSSTPYSPLDGITITWVSGAIDILIGFQ